MDVMDLLRFKVYFDVDCLFPDWFLISGKNGSHSSLSPHHNKFIVITNNIVMIYV
jgi:hypothetical protein